jgi:hypothetical protein
VNHTSSELRVSIFYKEVSLRNNFNFFFRVEQNESLCTDVGLSDVLEALRYSGSQPCRRVKQAKP